MFLYLLGLMAALGAVAVYAYAIANYAMHRERVIVYQVRCKHCKRTIAQPDESNNWSRVCDACDPLGD